MGTDNAGGRQQQLTTPEIVSVALRVVDRDGLAGLSMRSLAKELGCDPMAVYRHISGREELLTRISALVLSGIVVPPASLDTREWLRQLAANLRSALHDHPEAVILIGHSQLSGGSSLDLIDQAVARLSAGHRPPAETVADRMAATLADRLNLLIGSLIGYVTVELSPLPSDPSTPDLAGFESISSHIDELDGVVFGLRADCEKIQLLPGGYALLTEALIAVLLGP